MLLLPTKQDSDEDGGVIEWIADQGEEGATLHLQDKGRPKLHAAGPSVAVLPEYSFASIELKENALLHAQGLAIEDGEEDFAFGELDEAAGLAWG